MRRVLVAVLAVALGATLGAPLLGPTSADAQRTFGTSPLDDVLHWADKNKRCGLSRDKLAAIVLAPTYPETGSPSDQAPSPMTLSRWDNQSGLYSFGDSGSYRKAFWHPGVGAWAFDSAGGWSMTAAQRIDTGSAAERATRVMAERWCANPSLRYVWAPWHGCGGDVCEQIYGHIYQGGRLVNVSRDLGVSRAGGMEPRTCEVAGVGRVTCHRVDPARAQGYAGFAVESFGPSPVSAPFYVFSADGREHRHWLVDDSGYPTGIRAARPLGSNARTSLAWRSDQVLCDLTSVRGACAPVAPSGVTQRGVAVSGSYRTLVGDFDGDGADDILWYAPGGAPDYVWWGGNAFTSTTHEVNGSYRTLVGDFDGDGADDIFWYAPGSGRDYVWYGEGRGAFANTRHLVQGDYEPLVGDLDGDGADDIHWYAPGARADHLWSGGADRSFDSTPAGVTRDYQPLLGDFDGNGADDIFWYAPGGTPDHLWLGGGRGVTSIRVDVNGTYEPFAGDFDGDGADDIFWYAPGGAHEYLWFGGPGGRFVGLRLSVNGFYAPFAVDLSGDGREDVVWHGVGPRSDYVWWARGDRTFDSAEAVVPGQNHPVVGNFDGVRAHDVLWYQPGSAPDAVWYGR